MGRAGVAGSGSRVGKNEENWNTSGNYVDYIPKLVTASTPTGNQPRPRHVQCTENRYFVVLWQEHALLFSVSAISTLCLHSHHCPLIPNVHTLQRKVLKKFHQKLDTARCWMFSVLRPGPDSRVPDSWGPGFLTLSWRLHPSQESAPRKVAGAA